MHECRQMYYMKLKYLTSKDKVDDILTQEL